MEQKEMNQHKCANCRNFTAYYTKGYCKFNLATVGDCWRKNQVVDRKGVCELWQSRIYQQKLHRGFLLKTLTDMLTTLQEIKQLEEEREQEEG